MILVAFEDDIIPVKEITTALVAQLVEDGIVVVVERPAAGLTPKVLVRGFPVSVADWTPVSPAVGFIIEGDGATRHTPDDVRNGS